MSVAADGENTIVVVPGANGLVDARDVAATQPTRDDVVLCQLEVPLAAIAGAASQARAAGALVVLNTAPADPAAASILGDVMITVPSSQMTHIGRAGLSPCPGVAASRICE